MIIGGQANGRAIADVWLYTFATREFEQLFSAATLPMGFSARYSHCASLVSLQNGTYTNVHDASMVDAPANASSATATDGDATNDVEQFGIMIVGGFTNQLKYVDDAWLLKLSTPYSFVYGSFVVQFGFVFLTEFCSLRHQPTAVESRRPICWLPMALVRLATMADRCNS
jgi:hypothetical protein